MSLSFPHLALGLLPVALLAAESPDLRAGLALRTGSALLSRDHLNDNLLGVGLSLDVKLQGPWSLRSELAYTYRPGRSYRGTFLAPAPGQAPASETRSGDWRKNRMDALGLRGAACYALGGDWTLQGGLQVGKSRFTHEYVGQTVDAAKTYDQTYNGVPVESAMHVSPFLGVAWAYDRQFTFEASVVGQGYTAIDFRHTPGAPLVSGDPNRPGSHLVYAGDALATTRRMVPSLELGCRFLF